ncbi:Putative LPSBP6 [Gryllus bimaculatus]|nr:Putative LPSBP6 [Gryllus bimaculatus]
MLRSSRKDESRTLALLAHLITILTVAASQSSPATRPTAVPLPSVPSVAFSDLPPFSSASPEDVTAVEATASATPPSLECISADDKEFKFVLSTHRNSTGHWLADPPPKRVPRGKGYRYYPGYGFYKRHQVLKSWYEARAICEAEGTDLVVINSEDEAKLMLELSAPLIFLKPGAEWNIEAYVGAYDFHAENEFFTVQGIALNETGYVKWSPGEPNNHRDEDCVTLRRNAMFNDVSCNHPLQFICELSE